ncbi:hypothetical protein PMM47T1_13790 [Pseudomonas sp. M47T1]|uniref:hypothetical protein n=1 Tax=Pseudomonas sp. M47T1 TaxID=1179778 RepID=UPI00026085D9|nr:hypothetical protein [Pseudomonas sp. M47T1]EIK96036.1 hypothetical protein PMM47T1_13790 [Pseudomonas sp. M47T1]
MTINIAIATRDVIILGCDSLSSVVETAAFPLRNGIGFARDADGNELLDSEGRRLVPVEDLRSVVTNVYGGVNKMFPLFEHQGFAVAAVTAGKATLSGLTIAEIGKRFCEHNGTAGTIFESTEQVAQSFYAHVRSAWETEVDFQGTDPSLRNLLPPLQFIVAGNCSHDAYGRVFKIDIPAEAVTDVFPVGDHCGATWAGQADFVERILLGVDHGVKNSVQSQFEQSVQEARNKALVTMVESLTASGVQIPEGLAVDFMDTPRAPLWDGAQTDVQFQDLSTQYAIDFVELLVNTQSGMQRFGRGIPTVGGRTHIGVLRRGEGFKMLNEPELTHNHTGYAHDL